MGKTAKERQAKDEKLRKEEPAYQAYLGKDQIRKAKKGESDTQNDR